MKIQDLRIGNYVQLYGKQVKVLEIWDTALKTTDIRTNCAYFIEQYSPIPLTEETLLKCGFIARTNVFFKEDIGSLYFKRPFKCSDYFLVKSNGGDKITSLKYLHQLQNMYYSLTNQELNYETN